jgi:hypothetical protein
MFTDEITKWCEVMEHVPTPDTELSDDENFRAYYAIDEHGATAETFEVLAEVFREEQQLLYTSGVHMDGRSYMRILQQFEREQFVKLMDAVTLMMYFNQNGNSIRGATITLAGMQKFYNDHS